MDTEREGEFLWKTENLAELLQVKVGTVKRWMLVGLITEADGWIKAGRLNRFVRRIVVARVEAGLFAKGLDKDGHPAAPVSGDTNAAAAPAPKPARLRAA
jgi:hypothetical protein